MKLFTTLILMWCLLFTTTLWGQLAPSDAQYSSNGNLLLNPSFEQGKKSWTNTAGTFTLTKVASEVASFGSTAAKIALSAQTLSFSQSVSTNSGALKQAVVGLLYKVDATITNFNICSLVDGVEQTCVPSTSLIADGLYHSIEIPTTLGTSSFGIKAKTTGSATGNVFLDSAYIKQGYINNLLTNNRDAVNIPITGSWTSNTSYTNFITISGDRAFFEGLITFSGVPNATGLQLTLPSGYVIDATKLTTLNVRSNFGYSKIFYSTGGTQPGWGPVVGVDTTHVSLNFYNTSASVSQISNTSPISFTAGDSIYYKFDVPIVGLTSLQSVYSSGVQGLSVGDIQASAGSCPTGTLLADGSAISRTTYSELFGKIGITHGQGDGSTTFNIPDYRGRALRGVDGGSGRDTFTRSAMATGGNASGIGSVQSDATKKNGLTASAGSSAVSGTVGGSDGTHTHNIGMRNDPVGAGAAGPILASSTADDYVSFPSGATQTLTGGANTTGSGHGHTFSLTAGAQTITVGAGDSETVMKNAAVNYCIRTSSSLIYGSFENYVDKTNAQTVGGLKTFESANPLVTRFNSTNSFGPYINFLSSGAQKFALGSYSSLTGSGTDMTPSVFAETGLGINFLVNGSTTKAVSITSSGVLNVNNSVKFGPSVAGMYAIGGESSTGQTNFTGTTPKSFSTVTGGSYTPALYMLYTGNTGDTALIFCGSNSFVSIITQNGTRFVLGAPGASQIGLTMSAGVLTLTPTAGTSGWGFSLTGIQGSI